MNKLSDALDAQLQGGTTCVDHGPHRAEAEVDEADRLGVRLRRLRLTGPRPALSDLPRALRPLGEPVEVIENEPGLDGGSLRTPLDHIDNDGFFEVEVRGEQVDICRRQRTEHGREATTFDLTRDALRRLVDNLTEAT